MQNFTSENLSTSSARTDFQPNPSTLLFIKQYARMCNTKKHEINGYHSFSVVACC